MVYNGGMLKHWYRYFYIVFCVIGAVIYLALFFLKPETVTLTFSLFCFLIAPVLYFLGTILYNIFAQFHKDLAGYCQLATGFLSTVAFGVGANALFGDNSILHLVLDNNTSVADEAVLSYYIGVVTTASYFAMLIVLGLMPLLKGINKTFGVQIRDEQKVIIAELKEENRQIPDLKHHIESLTAELTKMIDEKNATKVRKPREPKKPA